MLIGYEGYSIGNNGIADRRRILYWAKNRGHTIVDSRDPRADLIVVTSSSNLSYWSHANITKPIYLDVVDGLIGETSFSKDLFRGYAYWGMNFPSRILPSGYRRLLVSVAQRCKKVICSSPEQVAEWGKYGIQAIDILDFHEEIPKLEHSDQKFGESQIELFWEGLPPTLGSLSLLNAPIKSLSEYEFHLNVLTQLDSYKYMNKYVKVDVDKVLSNKLSSKNLQVSTRKWSQSKLEEVAMRSHVGVIPLELELGYHALKAENRLLIMWRLGLPVLVSPLPAYVRTMSNANIDGVCYSANDWRKKLQLLIESRDKRLEHFNLSQAYLLSRHNKEDILAKWDTVGV
jgi:hypothetical protein